MKKLLSMLSCVALLAGLSVVLIAPAMAHAQGQQEADAKAKEKLEKERKEKEEWVRLGRQSNGLNELIAELTEAEPETPKVLEIDPALLEKYRTLVRAGVDGVVVYANPTAPTGKRQTGPNIEATISFGYWTGRDKTKLPIAHNYAMKLKAVEEGAKIRVTELSVVEDTQAFFDAVKAKRAKALKETETLTGMEKARALMMLVDLDRYVGDLADAEKNWAACKEVINNPKMAEEAENSLLSPIKIARQKHAKFIETVEAYEKAQKTK